MWTQDLQVILLTLVVIHQSNTRNMTSIPSSSGEDYKDPDQKRSQCPCGKGDYIRVNDVKKQMDEYKKAMEKIALKEMGSQKIKQKSQNKAIEKLLASVPVKEEAMPNEQDRIVNGYVSKHVPGW